MAEARGPIPLGITIFYGRVVQQQDARPITVRPRGSTSPPTNSPLGWHSGNCTCFTRRHIGGSSPSPSTNGGWNETTQPDRQGVAALPAETHHAQARARQLQAPDRTSSRRQRRLIAGSGFGPGTRLLLTTALGGEARLLISMREVRILGEQPIHGAFV